LIFVLYLYWLSQHCRNQIPACCGRARAPLNDLGIEPYVKVFDKSERTDGTFSRNDFAYNAEASVYVCPGGKELEKYHRKLCATA
jgi:hypothetical protein